MKPKEKDFCRRLALCADPMRAVREAGFRHPEQSLCKLMVREDIAEEVKRLSRNMRSVYESIAVCGLYKLAYGGTGDALTLLYGDSFTADQLREMDLSRVSEIKRTDKGVEIKFCDRVKAVDKLGELFSGGNESGTAGGLLEAMRMSAAALGGRSVVDDGEV